MFKTNKFFLLRASVAPKIVFESSSSSTSSPAFIHTVNQQQQNHIADFCGGTENNTYRLAAKFASSRALKHNFDNSFFEKRTENEEEPKEKSAVKQKTSLRENDAVLDRRRQLIKEIYQEQKERVTNARQELRNAKSQLRKLKRQQKKKGESVDL